MTDGRSIETTNDPYQAWLGLAASDEPRSHYALLGLPVYCDDLERIERAARDQLRKLRAYQLHPDPEQAETCRRMIAEVCRARVDLVHPEKKRRYDTSLGGEGGGSPTEDADPGRVASVVRGDATTRDAGRDGLSRRAVAGRARRARVDLADAVRRNDQAEAFAELAYLHFLHWRLNEDERAMLLAEGRAYGVPESVAEAIVDDAAERAAQDYRRSLRPVRWALALAALGVVVMLAYYAQHELAAERRAARAGQYLAAARDLANQRQWEAAYERLGLARAADPLGADAVERARATIDDERYEHLLDVAQAAVDEGNWMLAQERIARAIEVAPHRGEVTVVQAALRGAFEGALEEELARVTALVERRRWARAEEAIAALASRIAEAGFGEGELGFDRETWGERIAAAREADWRAEKQAYEAALADGALARALLVARRAAAAHPQRRGETDAWAARVAARNERIAAIASEIQSKLEQRAFAKARARALAAELNEADREALLERVLRSWQHDTQRVAVHALEFALHESDPFVERAVIHTIRARFPRFEAIDAWLERSLARLPAAPATPFSQDLLVLEEIRLRDGTELTGEVIGEDSLELVVRPALGTAPPQLATELRRVRALEVVERREVSRLTGAVVQDVRRARLIHALDVATEGRRPVEVLDATGRLLSWFDDAATAGALAERQTALDHAVEAIATWCVTCLGKGRHACRYCEGSGQLRGSRTCPKCEGRGVHACPRCGGRGRWECRNPACEGGWIIERRGERFLQRDCPDCVGGWVDCPRCRPLRNRGMDLVYLATCERCDGRGLVETLTDCPHCEDGEVACEACGGRGLRAVSEE